MSARVLCGVWLALAVGCNAARAQASQQPMGTVTGHVICQDTQKPARFANVLLFNVPTAIAPRVTPNPMDSNATQAAFKAQMDAVNAMTVVQAQTALDGSFAAPDVPPGDYYAMAGVPGYVQPRNIVQAAYDAGEDLTRAISGVPIVHVTADGIANVEISVSRGAALEGRVQFDDGGPVSGALVTADPTAKNHKQLPMQFNMLGAALTMGFLSGVVDDRGRYRISGLMPGEYRVKATLATNAHMTFQHGQLAALTQAGTLPLTVYAPGTFHKADAKPVTLTAGEERTDQDITYNLNGLHTVSGRVTSAEDHHGIATGSASLTDDNDKNFARSAALESDGSFNIRFVPSGTYTLQVLGQDSIAEEKAGNGLTFFDRKTLRSYTDAKRQVIVAVGDVSGQDFELKPNKQQAADAGDETGGRAHVVAVKGH